MQQPPDYPPFWTKGELLDVKRYTNATYSVSPIHGEQSIALDFDSPEDCQNFVSWWYATEAAHG